MTNTTRELLVLGPRRSGKTTLLAAMRHASALAVGSGQDHVLVTEERAMGASAHALSALDEGNEVAPTEQDEEIALRVRACGADVLLSGWDPPGLALPEMRAAAPGTVVLLCVRADDPQAFALVTALPPLLRAVARASTPVTRVAVVVTQLDRLAADPDLASAADAPTLARSLLGGRLLGELLTLLPDTPVAAFAVSAWGYAEGAPLATRDGVPTLASDDPSESLHAWTPLGALEVLRFLVADV